jgi:hypothetical protein
MALPKSAFLCVAALLTVGCLSGCNSTPKDTGTVETLNPAEQQKSIESQRKAVENNPNIPPDQKQKILSQMSRAGQPAGEASLLSKRDASGNIPPATKK